MPKVAKTKSASRPSPLKATSGNTPKKPAPSPKAKASASSPKSQAQAKPATPPTPAKGKSTKAGANSKSKTSTKKSSTSDKEPNYLLLTRLRDTDDPTITRILSVPPRLTFSGLHRAMQIAYGWANAHQHAFSVNKVPPMIEDEDDSDIEFDIGPQTTVMRIGGSEEDLIGDGVPRKQPDAVTLADVFEDEKHVNNVEIEYEYDFGDSWEHDIVLMGRESPAMRRSMQIPGDVPIACIGGEGHPCAEDCGAAPGWEGLKEVFAKPKSRDPEDLRKWYKTECINGDKNGLNPYKWDIFDVNDGLFKLAKELKLA